jgi:hypothetical protein
MAARKNDGNGGLGARPFPPHLRLQPGLSSCRPSGIDVIGRKMRAMYDDLLHQPLPDRLVELLRRIDEAREKKSQ